ncbi:3'-5' exonuclease [Methylobacterium sp. 1030]|uniref:3'-5' exonuclease n=1 Tax=Methylobacterium sp. 1030 TaxID=3156404 RepID=UPI0033936095
MQTCLAFPPVTAPTTRDASARRASRGAAPAGPSRGTAGDAVPGSVLALDIETVPDARLMPADWPEDRFPKNAWHRIVAISFVTADILPGLDGRESYAVSDCRSGGEPGWDEARLLAAFWRFFDAGRYRVVTWNGRAFDMPTILARSMMHGIDAAAWFRRGTKWEGYGHRFAADWHTDLMDAMSGHGASSRMTLEEAAVTLGLPGKLGEHGSHVAGLVSAGEIDRVRAYCETDCINLFALYLRWAHLTGRTDVDAHDRAILGLTDFLDLRRGTRPHLGRFLDAWRLSADGAVTIGARRAAAGPPAVVHGTSPMTRQPTPGEVSG